MISLFNNIIMAAICMGINTYAIRNNCTVRRFFCGICQYFKQITRISLTKPA